MIYISGLIYYGDMGCEIDSSPSLFNKKILPNFYFT